MQFKLGLTIMFLGLAARAGMPVGIHEGVDQNGNACSMSAGNQTFENNTPHPLNERISVKIGEDSFQVYHPRTIDAANASVDFNHETLEAVLPNSNGSKALVITMIHSEEYEGPSSFTLINDNWRTGEKSKIVCSGLKFRN